MAVTVLVVGLDVATQWKMDETQGLIGSWQPPMALAVVSLVGYLPLVWRSRAPLLVFGLVWLHSVVCQLLIPGYRPTLAVLVALYTVASIKSLPRSLPALGGAMVVSAFSLAAEYRFSAAAGLVDTLVTGVLLFLLLDLGVWGVGLAVGANRRERALLQAARERAARDAVRNERTRLAMELHDVVAHSVTLMVLQAASAAGGDTPPLLRTALREIEATGKQTMGELRSLLRLLDESADDAPDASGAPPLPSQCRGSRKGPSQADADLALVIQRMRRAGLAISVFGNAQSLHLPPDIALAIHRVVQEGLTNALRYAGIGAAVELWITKDGNEVTISLRDDGAGRPHPTVDVLSGGRGLAGLTERLHRLGGSLVSGPTPGGGFELIARVPLSQGTAAEHRRLASLRAL